MPERIEPREGLEKGRHGFDRGDRQAKYDHSLTSSKRSLENLYGICAIAPVMYYKAKGTKRNISISRDDISGEFTKI
jgi:hypothetical protein